MADDGSCYYKVESQFGFISTNRQTVYFTFRMSISESGYVATDVSIIL